MVDASATKSGKHCEMESDASVMRSSKVSLLDTDDGDGDGDDDDDDDDDDDGDVFAVTILLGARDSQRVFVRPWPILFCAFV